MIEYCRHSHCHREVVALLDKDGVLRWRHVDNGSKLCFGTFAEPDLRATAQVPA